MTYLYRRLTIVVSLVLLSAQAHSENQYQKNTPPTFRTKVGPPALPYKSARPTKADLHELAEILPSQRYILQWLLAAEDSIERKALLVTEVEAILGSINTRGAQCHENLRQRLSGSGSKVPSRVLLEFCKLKTFKQNHPEWSRVQIIPLRS
jgi:hypothetical protein